MTVNRLALELYEIRSLNSITCRVASVAFGTTEHNGARLSHALPENLEHRSAISGNDPPLPTDTVCYRVAS